MRQVLVQAGWLECEHSTLCNKYKSNTELRRRDGPYIDVAVIVAIHIIQQQRYGCWVVLSTTPR